MVRVWLVGLSLVTPAAAEALAGRARPTSATASPRASRPPAEAPIGRADYVSVVDHASVDGRPNMRIGIVILPELPWTQARERWRRAEEYGFAHAWTYDHLAWRDLADGPWFDAIATLTAAATVTSTIRLGTLVASPNFRHPVHFAREVTALDDVSGGRLTLGLGAGAPAPSFDALVLGRPPLTPRQRSHRYGEFVELLDTLLRNERTTWRGEHYEAVDARSAPGCVQQPRVPFVLAANAKRGMALAKRFGGGGVTRGGRPAARGGGGRPGGGRGSRYEGSGDRY